MMFYGTPLLTSRVQHILDKNPVPRSRIVHQHMGHGAYQLAVLDGGTSPCGQLPLQIKEITLNIRIDMIHCIYLTEDMP